jgi:N-acetylneuraminic acid mutarotase
MKITLRKTTVEKALAALLVLTFTPLLASGLLASFHSDAPAKVSHPAAVGLTFADRVAYQRAIEEIYWQHRIWPNANAGPKPPLDKVMPQAQLEKKVEDYLRSSQSLEDYGQRPITAEQLQAEMDRMAQHTKQPDVLRELFEALGNDPFVIAECLARSVLAERLMADLSAQDKTGRFESARTKGLRSIPMAATLASVAYTLPKISEGDPPCTDDTWTATSLTNAPAARGFHTAVWTGSEMIVWGGSNDTNNFNTGGRYDPSTDSWTSTSVAGAPTPRATAAVWTGAEMIVWGGFGDRGDTNTGGKYNPTTNSWTPTSLTNAPRARSGHTAVWTGTQMIAWGGVDNVGPLNTGGKYNPTTNSWTPTSLTNAPSARDGHTAVWTGNEMIVWGGSCGFLCFLETGGRYNPTTDSWTPTSLTNAPSARDIHTAVWDDLDNLMIVWGGRGLGVGFNTGGRYNPSTDSWTATTTTNAPSARDDHTAVWTGSEMIVWGGGNLDATGGRYNPSTDSWTVTNTTNAPAGRYGHTAVWTGSQMIVWGGCNGALDCNPFNTGGRYCAQTGPPTITLSAAGRKVGGINTVRLTWSGATSTNIDVYRDGNVIATVPNTGTYTDSTGDTGRARYTYRVCEAGTSTCSNDVIVTFRQ